MKRFDPMEQADFICSIGQRSHNFFWGNISRKVGVCTRNNAIELPTSAQLQLLHIVTIHDRINITELATIMAVSPPSISVMVDRMVNRGWLNRERSAHDRRKIMISASAEAKNNIIGVQEVIRKEIINLIKAIGPETTKKWCAVLNAIEKACMRKK